MDKMSVIKTIVCENCNTEWPETTEFCQNCHHKLSRLETEFEKNGESQSIEDGFGKLKKKYDLSDEYFEFLLEEYPDASIRELDYAIKEVLKKTNTDQIKNGILQILCWNCQSKISSELNICPNCGIEFLSEKNYSEKNKAIKKDNKRSLSRGIIFVIIVSGLDALTTVLLGFGFYYHDFVLSLICMLIGFLELFCVMGLFSKSKSSFIGLILLNILSILGALMMASVINSIPVYDYQTARIIKLRLINVLIAIFISAVIIITLLLNRSYLDKNNINNISNI